jgi:hypothetical protein
VTAALAAFSIILQSLEHQEKLVEVTNWPLRFEFRRDKRHPDALVMLLALAYETLQFLTSEKKNRHIWRSKSLTFGLGSSAAPRHGSQKEPESATEVAGKIEVP